MPKDDQKLRPLMDQLDELGPDPFTQFEKAAHRLEIATKDKEIERLKRQVADLQSFIERVLEKQSQPPPQPQKPSHTIIPQRQPQPTYQKPAKRAHSLSRALIAPALAVAFFSSAVIAAIHLTPAEKVREDIRPDFIKVQRLVDSGINWVKNIPNLIPRP